MKQEIRAMMIGAHPDDCDFRYGGLALKYAKAGHKVKFLSLCNGCYGHSEMTPEQTAARRRKETQEVARRAGVEYEVWDVNDCELMADLETRKRLIREIRAFRPDVIFSHRPNDYHADHRNASLLVQDASYLLIVPNFCPEVPALPKMPVILYCSDNFQNPPFQADLAIGIDEVLDEKFLLMNEHVSQVYEWLPFSRGLQHTVPTDPAERLEWLKAPKIDRTTPPDDAAILAMTVPAGQSELKEARLASKFRQKLIERYGDAGKNIHCADVFALCEYGSPLTPETAKELFPF